MTHPSDRATINMSDKSPIEVIRVDLGFDTISIYFHGVLHVQLVRSDLFAIQSWNTGNKNYFIEYVNKQGAILHTEYDDKEAWMTILKALEGIF